MLLHNFFFVVYRFYVRPSCSYTSNVDMELFMKPYMQMSVC
jgi:hypothetical protein